ncbi:serine/threonine protein kinase, putative [Hepatocystis sp. ex Piliocolobus tephrosceles]|nr:serine/threonine protein kinase, putative [Hepatocystis sp. ex Piliocolobus tephrosceles]
MDNYETSIKLNKVMSHFDKNETCIDEHNNKGNNRNKIIKKKKVKDRDKYFQNFIYDINKCNNKTTNKNECNDVNYITSKRVLNTNRYINIAKKNSKIFENNDMNNKINKIGDLKHDNKILNGYTEKIQNSVSSIECFSSKEKICNTIKKKEKTNLISCYKYNNLKNKSDSSIDIENDMNNDKNNLSKYSPNPIDYIKLVNNNSSLFHKENSVSSNNSKYFNSSSDDVDSCKLNKEYIKSDKKIYLKKKNSCKDVSSHDVFESPNNDCSNELNNSNNIANVNFNYFSNERNMLQDINYADISNEPIEPNLHTNIPKSTRLNSFEENTLCQSLIKVKEDVSICFNNSNSNNSKCNKSNTISVKKQITQRKNYKDNNIVQCVDDRVNVNNNEDNICGFYMLENNNYEPIVPANNVELSSVLKDIKNVKDNKNEKLNNIYNAHFKLYDNKKCRKSNERTCEEIEGSSVDYFCLIDKMFDCEKKKKMYLHNTKLLKRMSNRKVFSDSVLVTNRKLLMNGSQCEKKINKDSESYANCVSRLSTISNNIDKFNYHTNKNFGEEIKQTSNIMFDIKKCNLSELKHAHVPYFNTRNEQKRYASNYKLFTFLNDLYKKSDILNKYIAVNRNNNSCRRCCYHLYDYAILNDECYGFNCNNIKNYCSASHNNIDCNFFYNKKNRMHLRRFQSCYSFGFKNINKGIIHLPCSVKNDKLSSPFLKYNIILENILTKSANIDMKKSLMSRWVEGKKYEYTTRSKSLNSFFYISKNYINNEKIINVKKFRSMSNSYCYEGKYKSINCANNISIKKNKYYDNKQLYYNNKSLSKSQDNMVCINSSNVFDKSRKCSNMNKKALFNELTHEQFDKVKNKYSSNVTCLHKKRFELQEPCKVESVLNIKVTDNNDADKNITYDDKKGEHKTIFDTYTFRQPSKKTFYPLKADKKDAWFVQNVEGKNVNEKIVDQKNDKIRSSVDKQINFHIFPRKTKTFKCITTNNKLHVKKDVIQKEKPVHLSMYVEKQQKQNNVSVFSRKKHIHIISKLKCIKETGFAKKIPKKSISLPTIYHYTNKNVDDKILHSNRNNKRIIEHILNNEKKNGNLNNESKTDEKEKFFFNTSLKQNDSYNNFINPLLKTCSQVYSEKNQNIDNYDDVYDKCTDMNKIKLNSNINGEDIKKSKYMYQNNICENKLKNFVKVGKEKERKKEDILSNMSSNEFEKIKHKIKQDKIKQDKIKQDKIKQDEIKQGNVKHDKIKQDEIKQGNVKHDKIKQDKIKQDKIKQDEIKQGNVKHDKIKHDKIKHDKIKQDKIKQDKIKQDKIKQDKNKNNIYEKKKNTAVIVNDASDLISCTELIGCSGETKGFSILSFNSFSHFNDTCLDHSNEYKIIGLINYGEKSQVYKCINIKNKKVYAMKVVSREESDLYVNNFMKKYIFLIKNPYKNIISIYDIFKDNLYYYIIMEYCEGCTLFDYFMSLVPDSLHANEIKKIMKNIFLALNFLHSKNLIHRDIKLENIMFKKKKKNLDYEMFGNSMLYDYTTDSFSSEQETISYLKTVGQKKKKSVYKKQLSYFTFIKNKNDVFDSKGSYVNIDDGGGVGDSDDRLNVHGYEGNHRGEYYSRYGSNYYSNSNCSSQNSDESYSTYNNNNSYSNNSYSNNSYSNNSYSSNSYSSNSYSSNSYSSNCYSTDSYSDSHSENYSNSNGSYSSGNDSYSNNNYSNDSYSNNNYSNDSYSNNNYSNDSYSNNNYSNDSYSNNYSNNRYSNDNYSCNNNDSGIDSSPPFICKKITKSLDLDTNINIYNDKKKITNKGNLKRKSISMSTELLKKSAIIPINVFGSSLYTNKVSNFDKVSKFKEDNNNIRNNSNNNKNNYKFTNSVLNKSSLSYMTIKENKYKVCEQKKKLKKRRRKKKNMQTKHKKCKSLNTNNYLCLIDMDMIEFGSNNNSNIHKICNIIGGTAPYMSPESLDGILSTSNDMWACGVILYVLMDGRFPFEINNAMPISLKKKILMHTKPYFDPNVWQEHPDVLDLCLRLLDPNPLTRIKNAREALIHCYFRGS